MGWGWMVGGSEARKAVIRVRVRGLNGWACFSGRLRQGCFFGMQIILALGSIVSNMDSRIYYQPKICDL
jgi:hypothetical protein